MANWANLLPWTYVLKCFYLVQNRVSKARRWRRNDRVEGWSGEALSLLAVDGGHPEERKDTDERKYHMCCQPLHPLSCFSLKFPSCSFLPCCVLEFFQTLSPRYLYAWHLKASNCQAVLHQGIPHDDWSGSLLNNGVCDFCLFTFTFIYLYHPYSITHIGIGSWLGPCVVS